MDEGAEAGSASRRLRCSVPGDVRLPDECQRHGDRLGHPAAERLRADGAAGGGEVPRCEGLAPGRARKPRLASGVQSCRALGCLQPKFCGVKETVYQAC